jgi:hypothetical protein
MVWILSREHRKYEMAESLRKEQWKNGSHVLPSPY